MRSQASWGPLLSAAAAVALIALAWWTRAPVTKHDDELQPQEGHHPNRTALLCSAAALLAAAAVWSASKFTSRRRKQLRYFDEANLPSVGRPHLFSGNYFDTWVPFDSYQQLDQLHKRLGKTFGLFYGPDPWVMTTDLALLERVFVSEGHRHSDRNDFRLPFKREFNRSLFQVNGDDWRRMRRLLGRSFTPSQMKADNVHEDIQRVCDQLLECIGAHGAQAMDLTETDRGRVVRLVDIGYAAKRFAAETISRIAFGRARRLAFEPAGRDQLVDAFLAASRIMNGPARHLSVMFDWLRGPLGALIGLTPMGRCLKLVSDVVNESVRLRCKASNASSDNDDTQATCGGRRMMIDSLLACYGAGKLDHDAFHGTMFIFLLAGLETSSTTLALACWLLARHPRAQTRLHASLVAEGEQSQYLVWCLQETMRLYPPVPTAIGRRLAHDLELELEAGAGGVRLASGTSVVASIWSIHRSREYWGEDADAFRPERFGEPAADGEAAGPHGRRAAALRFFAFGHGPRYCIGQHFAMQQLRSALARLVARYELAAVPSRTPTQLRCLSPNMIQLLIDQPIELGFISRAGE